MLNTEQIAKIRMARTRNIGPVTCQLLLSKFKTAQAVLEAIPELSAKGGRRIIPAPSSDIKKEIDKTLALGGEYIIWGETEYPRHLARFQDAPFILTARGHKHLLSEAGLAIIGARNASLNARKLAQSIAGAIGQHHITIISGLARGIDTSAHLGSLPTGTIAVIANGIDQIYPAENTELFHQIAQDGLILSERPIGATPSARFFPMRNRIIASLSKAVLVIEAAKNSGSLITAREAVDRGIDVMALPGSPIDPRSVGCNSLIQDGAYLVQHAEDVLDILKNFQATEPLAPQTYRIQTEMSMDMSHKEREKVKAYIQEFLSHDPISIDELVRVCHFSAGMVNAVLIEMELAGKIYRHHGNRISLAADQF